MPISRDTVQALQKAGAAVHDAHAALDASAQKHSAQVAQAVNTNPFGLENDSLFNSWRTLAGVVQELHAMEQNLRALHATVASLSADNAVVVSDLSAVAASAPKATKAKARKLPAKPVAQKQPRTAKPAAEAGQGNDAKVLAHLKTLLTPDSFTKIVQAQVADAVGIPKGSIGRSVSQLVIHGKLQAGDKGTYKLL